MNAPVAPPGCVTADFQGPFKLQVKSYGGFISVDLFDNPSVSVFVTSRAEGDKLIAAFTAARDMLPPDPEPEVAP